MVALSYNTLCRWASLSFVDFIGILLWCHTGQNTMFSCKPRSHMVTRQSGVISLLLMRSVRLLFALRLFYSSERICQIDLKTKLWLLPSTRLLRVMNEIGFDMWSLGNGKNWLWVTVLYNGFKVTTVLGFELRLHSVSLEHHNLMEGKSKTSSDQWLQPLPTWSTPKGGEEYINPAH